MDTPTRDCQAILREIAEFKRDYLTPSQPLSAQRYYLALLHELHEATRKLLVTEQERQFIAECERQRILAASPLSDILPLLEELLVDEAREEEEARQRAAAEAPQDDGDDDEAAAEPANEFVDAGLMPL